LAYIVLITVTVFLYNHDGDKIYFCDKEVVNSRAAEKGRNDRAVKQQYRPQQTRLERL
jgi:hypothetical protein